MQLQYKLITTQDGSLTVGISNTDITYHSRHGALAESNHIFVHTGLQYRSAQLAKPALLHVLEIGFGTGLNALLTAINTSKSGQYVHYTTLEPYPLPEALLRQLHYPAVPEQEQLFQEIHTAAWEQDIKIREHFTLHKKRSGLTEAGIADLSQDVVYFDAFAPEHQPELWTPEVFSQLYAWMRPGAVLTTYCAKGAIRRMMRDVGFRMERLDGPPAGKREILRANKPA